VHALTGLCRRACQRFPPCIDAASGVVPSLRQIVGNSELDRCELDAAHFADELGESRRSPAPWRP
jgi:hypothetical protein